MIGDLFPILATCDVGRAINKGNFLQSSGVHGGRS